MKYPKLIQDFAEWIQTVAVRKENDREIFTVDRQDFYLSELFTYYNTKVKKERE